MELTNIRKNRMGTVSFDLKLDDMRKPQSFSVYPISKDVVNVNDIKVQSNKRFGFINVETGAGELSKSYPNGAYMHTFVMDKAMKQTKTFQLSERDLAALKQSIFLTADKEAGNSGIHADNSGAIKIL
jgi:hypothetical protein